MRVYITVAISFLCLGVSLSAVLLGARIADKPAQDGEQVATVYRPPSDLGAPGRRSGGGSRMIEQPHHRDVV
jgi:hypothetical protein